MGRKVHPYGFRLKVIRDWKSRWFAEGREYSSLLEEDRKIRDFIFHDMRLRSRDGQSGVSHVDIERFPPNQVSVIIWTARPGVVIGRKGENVKKIRTTLEGMVGKKIDLEIKEIKSPDLDAYLVARNIAEQLERRISYQRAMKRSIQQAMRQGALGVRVEVGGRLSGAEMARSVNMREGRVPRQTLRADIDYFQTEALTTYGQIGVKVWIYRGDKLPEVEEQVESTEGVYVSE